MKHLIYLNRTIGWNVETDFADGKQAFDLKHTGYRNNCLLCRLK